MKSYPPRRGGGDGIRETNIEHPTSICEVRRWRRTWETSNIEYEHLSDGENVVPWIFGFGVLY
jgi:hypothetical protein